MPLIRDPEEAEPRLLNAFADLPDKHILEIGCGDGRLTWRYADQPRRVTAIDPDNERLAEALVAWPDTLRNNVAFMQSEAAELPFAAATFDGAILAWSL